MFTKNYLNDPDLAFLPKCNNNDLKVLADLLVYGKDDTPRISEGLSKTRTYRTHYPEKLANICKEMVHELQLFGGNTIANSVRGHGVTYREIVMDVCRKKKVGYSKTDSTESMETNFLQKVFKDAVKGFGQKEVEEWAAELGVDATNTANKATLKEDLIHAAGNPQLTGKVAKACAKAIVTQTNMDFGGTLTAMPITGPAYRVTMPAVIWILYLREKQKEYKKQVQNFKEKLQELMYNHSA